MKKIGIIIGIIILVIVLGIILMPKYQESITYKGFTETEIKWIKSLSEENQKYFLETIALHPLLKLKDFENKSFTQYIELYKKDKTLSMNELTLAVYYDLHNKDINIANALKFIESKEFEPNRLERYLEYQKNNNNLEVNKIIELVNQDIDTIMMKFDESIDTFLNEKYFIKENLERYVNYQKKYNTNSTITVSYVNSNLDYDYYTNTQNVDISKDLLILVNKYYALDSTYIPDNLVTIESKYGVTQKLQKNTYEAFKKMANDAKKQGLTLYIQSPYRSYQTQKTLYNRYKARDGQQLADTYSARPGYSEHQTGLAIDIVNGPGRSLASFDNTKEFYWMKNNAHLYGFILRYPSGKTKITGYQYEPWHYRYVGTKIASEIKKLDITYEEYYAYYIK